MYAIIVDGGRQYKVVEGQELALDYREANPGDTLKFDQVLAIGSGADLKFGAPTVAGASVSAEVLGLAQGPKIEVVKLRRRKNSRRHTGHRKKFTRVKIGKIGG
ncbi:50S ribosomal protein L21 [Botrimarina hoheduenensis]|uniref:Large ribosomal subunit protein bL21 n=1 Tax=Botrimarina hoheduenensis TaxID=2528000 RepID=A0A5C5W6K9_9BACT|nr:50S ribosomal protein L21 [Botrimarina hoheduenensis]TWT46526.1 50S ribosomal protein L21 [Botrimarina hoheduenensis]